MSDEPPYVEPVDHRKAWSWGNRTWRLHLSLRDFDRSNVQRLMRGTGLSEAAWLRQFLQRNIARELGEPEQQ